MWEAIRKHNADGSYILKKSTNPGKLKSQKEWISWSLSLSNYLSNIIDHNGFPLILVIRKNSHPNYDGEDDESYGCEKFLINWAPLYRLVYNDDAHKVK